MSTGTVIIPLVDESIHPTRRCRRFGVAGMSCSHCERAVEAEVLRLDGVRAATADADAGTLIVESVCDVPVDAVRAAVDEAGYELVAG